ncbi:HEAT repeat domain-containing protein [Actinomycetospora sp.]|uniref:HEAT repeat domain-containing protein n=1 Tax=Actinomycetospora sp. TaxID=1872135 RepID=UPI002F40FB53
MLRFLVLLGAAIGILVLGSAAIWMVQRMRQGASQRARRTSAARRRVANAAERADLATSTISVPDRFGALGTEGVLQLTAEPQPGDLSASVVAPAPPFDLTAPGAADALQDWEAATVPRRRTLMIRGYLAHPIPRVRAEALDLIGTLGSEDARAANHLAVLLRDDSEPVRRKAATMAWAGGVDGVVDALREEPAADAAERAHAELVMRAPPGREAPALR